jgi:ribosomal-protein-alanine N-acetyltransferase
LKTFETERLLLKPTSKEDVGFILELFNTPKWIEFIGDRKVQNSTDAEEYIETKILPQFERLGYGNYTVIRKLDEKKIGCCGLFDREGLEGIDIGFALLPIFEKQGYAFECVNKLKEAAFQYFKLTELLAITDKNNLASQHLLQKIGLSFVGNTTLPHKMEEVLLYQLVNLKTGKF